MVDTNSDPDHVTHVTHVIPSNDDSVKSIQIILQAVAEAIRRGQAALVVRQSDAKTQMKIVVDDEIKESGAVKMDAELKRDADKVTDKDEAVAIEDKKTPVSVRKPTPKAQDVEANVEANVEAGTEEEVK